MDRKLRCEIITPEKIVYQGDVDMVVAPGVDGELGIMPLHAPLITALKVGEVRVKHGPDHQDYIAVDGGYLEIREDKVTVLADSAELASKLDTAELNRIKSEAEARLSALPPDSEEFFGVAAELERLTNRIRVAERQTK